MPQKIVLCDLSHNLCLKSIFIECQLATLMFPVHLLRLWKICDLHISPTQTDLLKENIYFIVPFMTLKHKALKSRIRPFSDNDCVEHYAKLN